MGDRIREFSELKQNKIWDVDGMTPEELRDSYAVTDEQMSIVYKFVLGYNDYINRRRDYSSSVSLTMLEVHLLTDICDRDHLTVTKLAEKWHRSASATSQTVRQLIKKGLVERVNSDENRKVFYLVPTEQGREISENHKRYDVADTIRTVKALMRGLDYSSIEEMFKVLSCYTDLLNRAENRAAPHE